MVAENIKRFRKERGLTQEQLGTAIGITGVAIMRYEKGQRTPDLDTIEKIASALGVAPFDLMGFNYWDQKNPDVNREVASIEAWDNYLNSIGYIVRHTVTKWHWEDNSADPSERVQEPDECEHTLIKEGHEAIFTDSEYKELQKGAREAIEGKFYKKIMLQK